MLYVSWTRNSLIHSESKEIRTKNTKMRKDGNLKNFIEMHSTYLMTLMTNHFRKILSIFWICYVMIEKMMFITWKSVDCHFIFSYWKILACESLSHEIFLIPSFGKVYPKHFANLFAHESFSEIKYSASSNEHIK